MSFLDHKYICGLDYDHLPALVRAGQSREQILREIVDKWCTSFGAVHGPNEDLEDAVDRHVQAGGYVLEGVALWDETVDGETDGRPGAPVNLGNLLWWVEQRLSAADAGAEFEQRPDLYILLRGCRVYRCDAGDIRIRPRFVSVRVQFDSASFAGARFGDSASFLSAKFGDFASFWSAKFGNSASFWSAKFGDFASLGYAEFGDSAFILDANFGGSASLNGATFGKGGSFAGANLNHAALNEANLSECDLRYVRGLVLDETRVRDAQFSPRSNEATRTQSGDRHGSWRSFGSSGGRAGRSGGPFTRAGPRRTAG